MKLRVGVIVPTVLTAALIAPPVARAESVLHRSSGEESFSYYPEHFKSARTRDEVRSDVSTARSDGTLTRMFTYQPGPQAAPVRSKTRGEVAAEVNEARKDGTLERMFTYQPAPKK